MGEKKIIKTKKLTIEIDEYSDGTFTVSPYSENMCDHEIVGVMELLKAQVTQNFVLQAGNFPGTKQTT